jgi:hypothetical protein
MDKLQALVFSRRFWAAVSSVVVIVAHENFGIPEETAQAIVAIALTWIVGDSLNKTRIDS